MGNCTLELVSAISDQKTERKGQKLNDSKENRGKHEISHRALNKPFHLHTAAYRDCTLASIISKHEETNQDVRDAP
jgi:hypothetical protein